MEARSITLPHKSAASLRLSTYTPHSPSYETGPLASTLVVFLNGLGLPRAGWLPAAAQLLSCRELEHKPVPLLVAYDRYGQGESDSDPTDPADSPYGHDIRAVVTDLHALIEQISAESLGAAASRVRLVLVANSIGCAVARLYAAAYPGTVEALLLLDPMMANTDFVSLLPDVDAPGFDAAELERAGVSAEEVRHARTMTQRIFHPSAPNGERLDRRNLPELLPKADAPVLPNGPGGRSPILVVVGHDAETFGMQSEMGPMKVPKRVTDAYTRKPWEKYNAGVIKISPGGTLKIAKGCGHFIQKDDPGFVAAELNDLLDAVAER